MTATHEDSLSHGSASSTPEQQKSPSRAKGNTYAPRVSKLRACDHVADSSSTSTARTTYNDTVPNAEHLAPSARMLTSTQATAGDKSYPSPKSGKKEEEEESTDVEASEAANGGGGGSYIQVGEASAENSFAEENIMKEGQIQRTNVPPSGALVVPLAVPPGAAADRSVTAPRLKGTLQVSGVRTGNVRIAALGGNDPFLRVRTCDQLRRTDAIKDKGEKPPLNAAYAHAEESLHVCPTVVLLVPTPWYRRSSGLVLFACH